MKITFLATNTYKVVFDDVNKDDTIDKLKLRLFRDHSDHLPKPSTIYEDLDQYSNTKTTKQQDKDTDMPDTKPVGQVKDSDDDQMKIDTTNLLPQILHPHQVRLIFSGKQLDSFSTVEDNKITEDCTILVTISPFYLVSSNPLKKPSLDDNTSNSDRIFASFDEKKQLKYQLSLDDQVGEECGVAFSKLDELNIVEASQLLMRVPSLEGDNTSISNNNNSEQSFKLHQSEVGAPSVEKQGLFTRMRTRRAAKLEESSSGQGLEAQFDQLSLGPTKSRQDNTFVRVPLEIITRTPTGANLDVNRIQVVFNRSFIPLCADVNEIEVPFRVEPAVPNASWRWIDGVTCVYTNPKDTYQQFTKSTKFTVTPLPEVFKKYEPSITREEMGDSWTFETSLNYPMFATFNGDVNNPQVLVSFSQKLPLEQYNRMSSIITLTDDRRRTRKFKILDPVEDLKSISESFKDTINIYKENRCVILSITDPVYINTTITLRFTENICSQDGPLPSSTKLELTFKTPAALKVDKVISSYEGEMIMIYFNGFVERVELENLKEYVKIEPSIEIEKIKCDGLVWSLFADFKPNESYTVKVSNVKSKSQTLENTYSNVVKIPQGYPSLQFDSTFSNNFNLDPFTRPIVKVTTRGITYLQITCYVIKPFQFNTFTESSKKVKLLTKEIQIKYAVRKPTDTLIDLTDFFGGDTPMNAKYNQLLFRFHSKVNSQNKIDVDKYLQYSPFSIGYQYNDSYFQAWVTNLTTQQRVKTPFFETYDTNAYDKPHAPVHSIVGSDGLFSVQRDKSFSLLSASVTIDKRTYITLMPVGISKDRNNLDLQWDVIDDLGCYRPTETVNIMGQLRISTEDGVQTPLEFYGDNTLTKISYKLHDTRKKLQSEGSVTLNWNGSFHIKITLAADINLGDCKLDLETNTGYTHIHTIKVLECKRKDFYVESDVRKPSKIKQNQPFYVSALGKYLNEEVMANTKVNWNVTVSPSQPTFYAGYQYQFFESSVVDETYQYESKPNPSGRHHLRLVVQDSKETTNVNVRGEVIDLTNKSESFSHSFQVHGCARYFGLSKRRDQFMNIDETFETNLIASDSLGNLTNEGTIKVEIKMVPWEEDLPYLVEHESTLIPSSVEPLTFRHKFAQRGAYYIKCIYNYDDQEPQIQSHNIYVLGKQTDAEKEFKDTGINSLAQFQNNTFYPSANNKLEYKYPIDLSLKVNGSSNLSPKNPKIGDKLEFLVTCKLSSGFGFITLAKKKSIKKTTPFTLTNGEYRFEHVVVEEDFPEFKYSVFVEGKTSVTHNKMVVERYTSGQKCEIFNVDHSHKQLSVQFLPYRKLQSPNQEMSIVTQVVDHNKKPVNNVEVTLIVADESLLSLTNRSMNCWNPIDSLYGGSYGSLPTCTSADFTLYYCPKEQEEEKVVKPVDSIVNITVKYLSGRVIQMQLPLNADLVEVRKVILERDGLPFTSQRLMFKNKQIEKGTLAQNGIDDDATLNLLIRLSGGGNTGDDKDEIMRNSNLPPIKTIKVRDNFSPLATFQTNRFTDLEGKVTFNFKLPDNLTKYRIMAFASNGDSFGRTQEFFTSTLPVMIRQNPPRFLNYNDECTFPIIVSNIVDYDVEVQFAYQTTNCLTSSNGFKSVIPANSRIIAPFKVKAVTPNTKSFYHVVLSSKIINAPGVEAEFTDAVKFDFPVYSPTSVESNVISNFTSLKNAISSHPVKFNNWQQLDQEVGGLSVNVSCTNLSQLTTSYKYFLDYKHSCSEQLASKLLCLTLAQEYPELLESDKDAPSAEETEKAIREMLEILQKRLKSDGSFKYWNSDSTYEYVNIYVYWVLLCIEEYGVLLPVTLMSKATKYLCNVSIVDEDDKEYKKIDKNSYLVNRAFALHTIKTFLPEYMEDDEIDPILMKEALNDKSPISLDLLAYLLPLTNGATTKQFIKLLENKMVITGTQAYFESFPVGGFYSSMRMLCFASQSLLSTGYARPLLVKIMAAIVGNLKNRESSMYFNTQDHALTMYTMACYRDDVGKVEYNAQVYLNDFTLEKEPFKLTIDEKPMYSNFIPMKTLIKNQGNIVIEKIGKGDMFYNLTFKYAKQNPFYRQIDNRGYIIEREFLPVSSKTDIQTIITESGQRQLVIKSGARIKVKINVKAINRATFVVINDHLPAGLEPTNNQNARSYWFTHINVRDKGAEVFADHLYPGQYSFTYTVQALCHGNYICPPATIEEMYCASSFGRTSTDVVIIV